ncbi:MAG: protein kinase, partial [Verrucomicrobiota bacterium]|nr:protein kinase [Verrucomicrobiota bacterium]
QLALFRKICAAVAYAHQHLVVHRDLKPANIRVTPEGEPKLLDFGIAKLLETDTSHPQVQATLTMAGALTPEYASPEQIRGEAITTASDVYSLGVILYELLTGQRPFVRKQQRPDELARAICEEEPARPSTVICQSDHATAVTRSRRRLEGDLDNIVAMALRKEPARRYASVAQFSEDLRRHDEGLPVIARKDTFRYRTGKFVRRNKVGVAAAALVVLALLGGLIATTWQTRIARQERDHARVAQRQAEQLDSFMQSLLRSADPANMGKDVKVIEVLEAASKNVDRELAAEPEVLAKAHESLSSIYGSLGRVEPSERHIQAAFEIRRRLRGPDDPLTIRAEFWLAGGFCNREKWREAEPLVRHVIAVRSKQNPPDIYALASANEVLGAILDNTGRREEGLVVLQKALADLRLVREERNRDFVRLVGTLAFAQSNAGHLEEAEKGFRRAIALSDQPGPQLVQSVGAQLGLVTCLFRQEKISEAEKALQRLETDSLRMEGDESIHYSEARVLRGCLDFHRGDYAKVIDEVRRPLEVVARAFPKGHVVIVQARGLLGLALTRTGRATEGEPFLSAAVAESSGVDREPFAFTFGNIETALGECLLAQERYAEAEPLLLAGYADLTTRLGEHHAMAETAARRLREFYAAWNKPAEAAQFAAQQNSAANIDPVGAH